MPEIPRVRLIPLGARSSATFEHAALRPRQYRGRCSTASTCLLLYAGPLGETARECLQILRETEDGFLIAEEDLKLGDTGEGPDLYRYTQLPTTASSPIFP